MNFSECWESNPVNVLPKHAYCRYTTLRQFAPHSKRCGANLFEKEFVFIQVELVPPLGQLAIEPFL